MTDKTAQKFVLFAENQMFARKTSAMPDPNDPSAWGPQLSDFGYIISGTPIDDYPPADYLERASLQTYIQAAWDDRFLFFRIKCDEPQMRKAIEFRSPSIHYEHDFRAREDVQIHIDTPYLNDQVLTLSIGIDGRLAQRKTKPASQRKNTNYQRIFDLCWDADVIYRPDGWLAIAKIPFTELGIEPEQGFQFGINFTRNEFAIPQFTVWRGTGYWTIIPEKMGKLILSPGQIKAPPSPTVILRQFNNKYKIDISDHSAKVTVNDKQIDNLCEPFDLMPFSINKFNVTTPGQTLAREIPVASDTDLIQLTPVDTPSKDRLLRKLQEYSELAENDYCGNGIYKNSGSEVKPKGLDTGINKPDLTAGAANYRNSALRAEALLYADSITHQDKTRAVECLEWLISQQRADGCMPYFAPRDPFAEKFGLVERHTGDSFYENGNVGRALVKAYKELGEYKYLAAAIRIAQFNATEPTNHNHNYNAFCLYFEPELTTITGDQRFIWNAIEKYRTIVRTGQLLNGEWTAHNRHTCYMGIMGHGISRLARALPDDSRLKDELRARIIRTLNCFISRLDPKEGTTHPHPTGTTSGAQYALLTAVDSVEAFGFDLDNFMSRIVNWMLEYSPKLYPPTLQIDALALARYINLKIG